MKTRSTMIAAALAALAASSCAGNPIPAPIEGEIVCADFEVGAAHQKIEGSLKHPVRLRILDGKTVVMKMTLPGLRAANATPARSLIADDNDTYQLEWAQCENERAPQPVHGGKDKEVRDTTHYECGEAKVYKTDSLTTKKHDPASHVIQFAMPPEAVCWTSEAMGAAASPTTAPSASAAASAAASASAMPVDAGTAAPATSASAAPAASASAAPKK